VSGLIALRDCFIFILIEQSDNHKKWQPDYPRKYMYIHTVYSVGTYCTYYTTIYV